MDLVLGQSPAVAAAASAADAAGSATAAATSASAAAGSATAAAASAATINAPGNSVISTGGKLEVAMPIKFVALPYTLTSADRGVLISATATGTITLPTDGSVGSNFYCVVRNTGGSGVTLTLSASGGNIDGSTTITSSSSEAFLIRNDGTNWRSIGRVVNDLVTNARLANMAANTIKGNNTGVSADPADLTVGQVMGMLNLSGINSGDQIITLTGDVTGTGTGSFAAAIANNAVTNAKAADMPANTLKGNNTGITGDPLDLTAAQVKTMLNLAGNNNGDQTITLTGDVTGSGTGSFPATIANNAVTNAKAADMAAMTLKGNNTAATGDPLDLTVAQVKTLLNLAGTNNGDQTITLTGDVTGSGTGSFAATIAIDAVTNVKLANMAANTLKGNNSGATTDPADLTATQVTAMLNAVVGDNGSGGTKGLVPAPTAGDAAAGKVLGASGAWVTPASVDTTPFIRRDGSVHMSQAELSFDENNAASNAVKVVGLDSFIYNTTAGSESGGITVKTKTNGTDTAVMEVSDFVYLFGQFGNLVWGDTNLSTTEGPSFDLQRAPSSRNGANGDIGGVIRFRMKDSAGNVLTAAKLRGVLDTATDGSEASSLHIGVQTAGAFDNDAVVIGSGGTVNAKGGYHLNGDKAYQLVQRLRTNFTGVATGTTIIPPDDTIPQITEGNEYMTQTITPKNANNKLKITIVAHFACSAAIQCAIALFQDSTANALAAWEHTEFTAGAPVTFTGTFEVTAGTTSATTFRVRIGPTSSGTITFNGVAGARRFGGVSMSSIEVEEYEP